MKTTTAAAALAAAAALTSAAIPAASASPVPSCRSSQLHLRLGHERAATGHVTWTLTALDEGPACNLPAFPKLGLEDVHGRALHSVTADTGKAGGGLLLYGLTATATVSYGSGGMTGETAAYLTDGSLRAPFPGGTALLAGGKLWTSAWKVDR